MSLLIALLALSLLAGAAVHGSLSTFLVAATVISAWLLAFGVREGLARRKHQNQQ